MLAPEDSFKCRRHSGEDRELISIDHLITLRVGLLTVSLRALD